MTDLTGQRFGRLVAESEAERKGRGRRWVCRCDCGRTATSPQRNLTSGKTKSCGCLHRERAGDQAKKMGTANRRHGLSGMPEHNALHAMWQRCTNPNSPNYPHYGGRGIGVCDRWQSFEAFLADMGPRPGRGYSLDRIDPEQGYEPENCRWADDRTQQRNRREHRMVTYKGEAKCVGEWAEEVGLTVSQLWTRLFLHGWSVERAMTAPLRGRNLITA